MRRIWMVIWFSWCFWAMTSQAQVQLFEQGGSGITARTGALVHPDVQSWKVGGEYNVEGKVTMGAFYAKAIDDSLFDADPLIDIKSTQMGGYGILEMVEPDKLFPLSFALYLGYTYHLGRYADDNGVVVSSHEQSIYSTGPQVGARFFVGNHGMFIPMAEYRLSLTREDRRSSTDDLILDTEDSELWHEVGVTLAYNHMFNDIFGVFTDPKAFLRIGDSNSSEFYVDFNVGLVIKLPN